MISSRVLGVEGLLGGPWDLVITYNWDYNPTDLVGVTLIGPFRRIISRVIKPVYK